MKDVSEGMKHAHKAGLFNLDMKSPNILVMWSEELGRFVFKVSDIGIYYFEYYVNDI